MLHHYGAATFNEETQISVREFYIRQAIQDLLNVAAPLPRWLLGLDVYPVADTKATQVRCYIKGLVIVK
jgi:hypothetical protein